MIEINNNLKTIFDKIANYIIEEAKNEEGQYIVENADIQAIFVVEIEQYIEDKIIEALYNRKETIEAFRDTDGYNIKIQNLENNSN